MTGFSPEILRGDKSLNLYADTSLVVTIVNGLVNCGYYEISCYRHAQGDTSKPGP